MAGFVRTSTAISKLFGPSDPEYGKKAIHVEWRKLPPCADQAQDSHRTENLTFFLQIIDTQPQYIATVRRQVL
jgi:hypothetical protein